MALDATLGVTRLGHYRLVRRLAVGGMAELFVAVAQGAGDFAKPVAIKRILPRLAAEEHFVEMFFEEARLAASLDHPHIAKVLDFGEEGGLPYIVMELVHGVDLGVLLRAVGGALPSREALTVLVQLAEALHHVHEQRDIRTGKALGLVHRDVSPSNVLVGYSGGVKLTDFGIVKATEGTEYTATGALKGKLSYLSPEQARCERVDRRTDIYALGLVMYELTTGRRMHTALSEVGLLARVCDGQYTPPFTVCADYDPELERVLAKALAPRFEDRYATAGILARDLEAIANARRWSLSTGRLCEFLASAITDPGPVVVNPTRITSLATVTEPSPPPRPRRNVMAYGAGIVLLGLGVGLGVGVAPALVSSPEGGAAPVDDPVTTRSPPAEVEPVAEASPAPDPAIEARDSRPVPDPADDAVIAAPPPEPVVRDKKRARPPRTKSKRRKSPKAAKPGGLDETLLPPSQRQ
ncbi:MAG: protein kinase [Myxococcota bacterium]